MGHVTGNRARRRPFFRHQRAVWARSVISAVAILLVVNMAPSSANAAAPKPSTPKAPTAPQMLSVTGVHPLAPHVPKPVYQAPGYVATATAWPAPASTTLHLRPAPAAVDPRIAEPRATTTGQTGHAGDAAPVVRAASAPLWAQALAGGPASVDLTITDQSLAQHLGIDGVVLTATAPTAGQVRVGIDYHSFAQVEGGNFGTRLGLVALPACALTTPTKIACQQRTLLPFTNDANTQSVSAAVGVPAVAASSAGVATAPSGPLVIAVVPLVSGDGGASAGTYSATTLKASGELVGGRQHRFVRLLVPAARSARRNVAGAQLRSRVRLGVGGWAKRLVPGTVLVGRRRVGHA